MSPLMEKTLSKQRSPEDEDLLERSTKKSKRGGAEPSRFMETHVDVVQETPLEAMVMCDASVDHSRPAQPLRSFRDAVARNAITLVDSSLGDQADDDSSSDEDQSEEDEDPLCPTIRFTKREKEAIREPWRQVLIIKVWGKRVGYSFLMRKLCALWRPKGSFEMIAIDNDYFLVKFGSKEDLDFAKFEGPWMILDHYLIVKEWEPNFDPMTDKTEKVLVWVRFPCLPIEYYSGIFLRKVGDKIGRPVRVDHATSQASRGRFVRICVEIDVTKPLLSKFTLEGKRRFIAYEGLHLVCFGCGKYGHAQEACPATKSTAMAGEIERGPAVAEQEAAVQSSADAETTAKPYGSWMVVTKPQRRFPQKPEQGKHRKEGAPMSQGKSRFQPLDELREMEAAGIGGAEVPEVEVEGETRGDQTQEIIKNDGRNISIGRKQRRANVIVNEKQIDNQKEARQHATTKGKKKVSDLQSVAGNGSRRAAEADEHVVVRGSHGGKLIQTERVVAVSLDGEDHVQEGDGTREHHSNDPDGIDEDGDAVMEVDGEPGGGHGTDAAGVDTGVQVQEGGEEPWAFAIVYGSPVHQLRKRMWDELQSSKRRISGPWLVAGDFNAVSCQEETLNYNAYSTQRSSDFVDWISGEGLIDLGFSGPRLTWARGSDVVTSKGARLDRALCNVDWRQRFPEAFVQHLPRVVKRAWIPGATVQGNINNVQAHLITWNKEVFGSITTRKRILLARIAGIQRALATSFHRGLLKLEGKLKSALEEVLYQEELMWFQRSREEWIVSGDRNTKFYHAATMVRKAQNRIRGLKDDSGNWMFEEDALQRHVQDFYMNLFRGDQGAHVGAMGRGLFPTLNAEDWQMFNRKVDKDEVKTAVFDMSPLKASGPDGLHAAFYQRMWDVVGDEVFELVASVLETGKMPEKVNDTLIVLIPKVQLPETIKQFRPISLVGPFQSSFVPGRQIMDNVILFQEVLHSMRLKKGKTGLMAIKIDLEKAYDRLNWDFIKDTLVDAGFEAGWVRAIMECVSTPTMSIVWNGNRTDQFKPGRGVRQGDAISPALFVLCIERLCQSISAAVNSGAWKGIRLAPSGPVLSHLCFADDMVLFSEATIDQVNVIMRCLDLFCEASGQKVSFAKSSVYFSSNTNEMLAQEISNALHMMKTTDLSRYLGVPAIHGRVTHGLYNGLIERVAARLDGWKSKNPHFGWASHDGKSCSQCNAYVHHANGVDADRDLR
ncbi:PREDICTED: uncharacterized protein LOC109193892 [Ipomoea nil]|uniref:uncharacterized protein LOC109193892 n=1 Tax=Ipomoea nil TaxID=35883 RepID=UPI000901F966|nr:PREDICTED: uncharacterized protein LOC109193892 [Ipomoea nil]